jgi:hypothetical protein
MTVLILGLVSYGAMAQDLKPYPVYFPVADYPEFNYGAVTYLTVDKMVNFKWYNDNLNGKAVAVNTTNCKNLNYLVPPATNMIAAPYGRALSLNTGYNRAMYMDLKTPYLNPGTYRIYMGVCWVSGGNKPSNFWRITVDSIPVTPVADTTLRQFNSTALLTAPNKQSLRFTGTGTVRHFDIFCGTTTITEAGIHKFHFESNAGGNEYAYTLLQFIPVTETNADADYDYPKFDMGGTVFKSAADSLVPVVNTPVKGYHLPYQVQDPTAYTKYNVTLDAGLYFEGKLVVVKRADDKWTRWFAGNADATGKVNASLPAGNYFIEVNNGQHTTTVEVTSAGNKFIGVETANINVTFSPELWYVGKKFQVWNSTGKILLKELEIPANGVVPTFALPVDVVNNYIYNILNNDETSTVFETGTISVPSTATVNFDKTATKRDVNINLGNDSYGTNQLFTIARADNANAVYISATSSANGTYKAQLPDGKYYFSTNSKLILKTFTVEGANITLDLTARYNANLCFGKAMAGAKVDLFLSSSKALLGSKTLDANGKSSFTGLTNGRFYHNAYKVSGADTTWATKKFTFVVEGANFDLGDCGNAEKPYYLPYPVYFDMCNQPEITWMKNQTFKPGELKNIKFDNIPVDTTYAVIDTTWTNDTTYVVNYDYNKPTVVYWDYNCHYGFNGITYDKAENCYVWGDIMYFRFPKNGKITFVTPNLNPGRYNIYMTNRWAAGRTGSGYIDTTYMDGKPLITTDGVRRTFSGRSDDYTNGMQGAGLLKIMNAATGTGTQQQGALYMGETVVTTPGRHELMLYSKDGCTVSGSLDYQGAWWNMIYFIPVDADTDKPNSTYYPRLDVAGNIVPSSSSSYQTTLGTDGINRSKFMGQFPDPSVYRSDLVSYSKKLTVDGGSYSGKDILSTVSPIDNWTVKQAVADSITGIASLDLLPNNKTYAWSMDVEGIDGTVLVNDNKTIKIPMEINTAVTSTYGSIASEDDPTFGTLFLNSKVTITDDLGFYYPITGAIVYEKDGIILKAEGDTIYKPKTKELNGIAPTYSFDDVLSTDYLFITSYTGSKTRLKSSMTVATYTGLKKTELSAGIYPNPASDFINLKLNENQGIAIYTIYNQLGQAVKRGSFTGTQANVSLGGVEKGLYLVKVNAGNKDMTTKLVVE